MQRRKRPLARSLARPVLRLRGTDSLRRIPGGIKCNSGDHARTMTVEICNAPDAICMAVTCTTKMFFEECLQIE
jgi:hypothetical protein